MLKINFEFRKGIFFIRLIGDLTKETYIKDENKIISLINENKFKYIVINTNYLNKVDLDGLNYITKIYYITKENKSNLVICDKMKVFKTLLNDNVLCIEDETQVL